MSSGFTFTDDFKKQVRILVVDDEESLVGILQETFSEAGFRVDSALSGEEAWSKFEASCQENHPYEVVLTDIRMPGLSGMELLEAIKKKHTESEVVIMTSHASMDTAISAMRAGAYDYLLKPFNNLEEVINLLDRVVDRLFMRFENQRLIRDLADKNEELRATNEKLIEKNRETQTLYNFSKFLTQTLELSEVLKLSLNCFSQLGNGNTTIYLTYYQGKLIYTDSHPAEQFSDKKMKALVSVENMRMDDIIAWFHRLNQEEVFQKTVALNFQTNSFFAAPVFVTNRPFGILISLGEDGKEFPQKSARLLNQFSQMVAVAVDNAQLHKHMKDQAIKDGLTGLFNHRYFQERLGAEVSRAQRYKHPVSLVFVDVDHFKKFNDNNGHPMGDMILRGVASLVLNKARKSDIVARYGGEEFVIILPETPKAGALRFAEDLRKSVEEHPFPNAETQPMGKISVSIGVASYPDDAQEVKTLVSFADHALYSSKQNGRNRVTAFDTKLVANVLLQDPQNPETPPAHP